MFCLLLSLSGLLAAGVIYQSLGAYRDTRRLPPPGKLIDIGGGRLHLLSQGHGSPAVILEAGIAATSISWALVQPEIAAFTRACSYDRLGLGWSSACHTPRTVAQMVSELHLLLLRAGIPPPYILVGHSFGGLLVRAFAHVHSDQIAGIVLVDPVPLEFWATCSETDKRRLQIGTTLSHRGALLARLGVVRLALMALAAGRNRFSKAVARATAGKGRAFMERLIGELRRLPVELWPAIFSHWSRPECFDSMAQHLSALPESARIVLSMPIPSSIPLIILSASNATEQELAERERWIQNSEYARHDIVRGSTHWLQLQYPDVVVSAVRELVQQARVRAERP